MLRLYHVVGRFVPRVEEWVEWIVAVCYCAESQPLWSVMARKERH